MATLPTNRTTSNTPAEHVSDHNTLHSLWNIATTKGDIITVTGAQAYVRLPVGTDGQALKADSSQPSGLIWGSAGTSLDGAGTDSIVLNGATQTVPATSPGNFGIAGGDSAVATGTESIAIGRFATADDTRGIAIGWAADADTSNTIAIGPGADINGVNSVGLGSGANANGTNGVVIGPNAFISSNFNVAVGSSASADTGTQAIAIGGGTNGTAAPYASAQGAIAIGASNASGVNGARASGANSVAIGSGDASTAGAKATGINSVGVGKSADSSQNYTVCIGAFSFASSNANAMAVGGGVNSTQAAGATGNASIAIGSSDGPTRAGAKATGQSDIAIGSGDVNNGGASASGGYSIAIGHRASSNGGNVAVGTAASAGHSGSTALGPNSSTTATSQVMLGGSGDNVVAAGSLAIRNPYRVLQIQDEFLGQNTANGDVGQLGWRTAGLGSTAVIPGEATHPGITVLTTGGTSANDRYLLMGDGTNQPFIATDVDRYHAIVRIPTITTVSVLVGLVTDAAAPPGTAGVYFAFDPAVNAAWQTITRNAGTSTTNTSAVTVIANNWYQLEARRNGSNWEMYINGTLRFTHSTNLPTTAVSPTFWIKTNAAASRDLHCDYFALTGSVFGQRWT